MRLRFSVFSCMAAAVLIALNAAAIRALGYRPAFLVQDVRWFLIETLPMVNVLAIGAYLAKTPGAIGFQVGGWTAVAATLLGNRLIDRVLEAAVIAIGAEAWIMARPRIQEIIAFGVIPALLLALQLLTATLGWYGVRKIWARSEKPRSRMASLAGLTAAALLPVLLIEATLRTKVDPFIVRLEPGVEAVVDFDRIPTATLLPPPPAPLRALAGKTVRVESDGEPNLPEMVAIPDDSPVIRDRRAVKVTLMDGSGESALVPYCTLRVGR